MSIGVECSESGDIRLMNNAHRFQMGELDNQTCCCHYIPSEGITKHGIYDTTSQTTKEDLAKAFLDQRDHKPAVCL